MAKTKNHENNAAATTDEVVETVQETAEEQLARLQEENAALKSGLQDMSAKLVAQEATNPTVMTKPIDGVVYAVRMAIRHRNAPEEKKGVFSKEEIAADEALCREILSKEGQQVLVAAKKK